MFAKDLLLGQIVYLEKETGEPYKDRKLVKVTEDNIFMCDNINIYFDYSKDWFSDHSNNQKKYGCNFYPETNSYECFNVKKSLFSGYYNFSSFLEPIEYKTIVPKGFKKKYGNIYKDVAKIVIPSISDFNMYTGYLNRAARRLYEETYDRSTEECLVKNVKIRSILDNFTTYTATRTPAIQDYSIFVKCGNPVPANKAYCSYVFVKLNPDTPFKECEKQMGYFGKIQKVTMFDDNNEVKKDVCNTDSNITLRDLLTDV